MDERSADTNTESRQSLPGLSLSREYDRWHQHIFTSGENPDQESPWYRLVLEYLAPLKGKRVLEVACGRGGFATVLESQGAMVVAADFSMAALRIAWQKVNHNTARFSRIAFSQTDAHHLPFANAAFDFIVSCETVEHLTNPLRALKEMARVCKPGGLLYLTTPNYLNLMGLYLVYDTLWKKDRRSAATQPLDHRWLFPHVRRIVKKSGWKILKADGIVHQVPFPGRDPVRLYFLDRDPSIRRLFSPTAFHYFILATKRGA